MKASEIIKLVQKCTIEYPDYEISFMEVSWMEGNHKIESTSFHKHLWVCPPKKQVFICHLPLEEEIKYIHKHCADCGCKLEKEDIIKEDDELLCLSCFEERIEIGGISYE